MELKNICKIPHCKYIDDFFCGFIDGRGVGNPVKKAEMYYIETDNESLYINSEKFVLIQKDKEILDNMIKKIKRESDKICELINVKNYI